MLDTSVERAVQLLFPEDGGRRALDVKFFTSQEVTAESLAEQIVACFAVMGDASNIILDVDQGLTS